MLTNFTPTWYVSPTVVWIILVFVYPVAHTIVSVYALGNTISRRMYYVDIIVYIIIAFITTYIFTSPDTIGLV